eukprot:s100_g6.t2
MDYKETSPAEAASGGQAPKKGKGKGPGKGPPPAKGAGKAKEASSPLPSWQKPDISAEWQPERMVNWQPIRQTSRIQGSVWQQVHDSLQGGAAQLPEDLLGRFMRKASEAPKKSIEQKKSAGTKRLLPSKQGLVADIHHALLTRKGIRNVRDLKWIIGPDGEAETQEDDVEDALSEDRRLALLGGLGLLGSLPLSDVRNVLLHRGTIAFVSGRLGSSVAPKLLPAPGPRTACHTAESPKSADSKGQGRVKVTPLWVLKITQMLLFGANVCLTRFITVYYHDLGLSRKVMGLLLVMVPMMAFVGGFFWSSIVDRSGSYRRILTFTSSLGIATVFSYMLPAVGRSLPLLVLVTLLQGFVTAPAGPIVDGLCLKVLAQRSEEGSSEAYGDQRLWSAVGWGAMALIAGKLIDIFGTNAIFLSYGILVGLNVLVVQLFVQDMPAGPGGHQGSSGTKMSTREWLADLARFELIWMLINLLVYGLLTSLVENYLNVFLVQDFDNVPRVILGAATAVMCSFEIPVFKYIGDLWSKRGYSLVSVLWASEFVMVLRCLLYASLPRSRPWLVLLVEPLHGLTFAGVWTATVEYARRLARTGTEAKMQALISGVYFNVAFAIGSLIWGFISQLPPAGLGFRRSFLLDAAVGSVWLILWAAVYRLERSLTAAGQSLKDGVQSEIFLRQILQSVPLQELQCRVQLCLDIARFPLKAADLESGLDLALSAAWSILDSRAVPILLEGILLLGNSVNASSKNLGGAVGVTLDSLTKLAHTRCLPAKQAGNKSKKASARAESALEVLAIHLDEANEGFMKNLASDLDACHAAKDFDRTLMDGLVQELATQTKQMKQSLQADTTSAQAAATSHARLSSFLEVADPKVAHLQPLGLPWRGDASRACLILVCGLPGSGKTSFSRDLVVQGGLGAKWVHFCYDEVEQQMRSEQSKFDPEAWQQARAKVASDVRSMLEVCSASEERVVIVLDDNMYYRSMRKRWYHLCREASCAYHQLFLQAPVDLCLERNKLRKPAAQVPDFSIQHMAEVFEWPPEAGGTWEAQGISTFIDASSFSSEEQVASCLKTWQSRPDFWRPVPELPEAVEETQSDSHHCDVALRKIVSRALADVPKEHSQLKSTLAKQWGAKKAEMSKKVAAIKDQGPIAEATFLQSCISDLQDALRNGQSQTDLLEEVDEATESLRQWFAEPSTSSLHDMLKVLSALRDMLPVAKPTAADAASRSRLYQNSETRKRRLQEKAEKATEKEAAVSLHVPETSQISRDEDLAIEATPEIVAAETQSNATVSEASEPEEAKAQAAECSAGASVTATVSEAVPSSVLAQILSFRQGTVWITWLFDWPCSVSMEGNGKLFEILQFNASEDTVDVKPEQSLQRWRCQSPPFKFDVALGCHHTFAVRAMLLPSQDHSQSPEAGALWVSAMSSLVTVDLRYYSNRPPRALPSANQGGAHADALAFPAPPVVSEKTETETPSPCRGRVASSIGDFLQSLQASGGGSPPRRPSFRTDISAQTVLPGQTGSPSNIAAPTAPIAAVPSKEAAGGVPTSTGEASPESHAAASEIPADKAPPEVSGDSCEKETEQLSLPFDEDALSPQSLPSRASGESWASEASLSDFDYADLSRLAQALRFPLPQSSTAGQTLQTAGQCSVPRANSNSEQVESVEQILNSVREESLDDISKQTAQGDVKTSSSFKVPRAVSIFDQDTLDSMAEVLSNVQNIDRSQQVAGLQPSLSGELLDGEEVLAAAQRAFQKLQEKPCSACGGTGYVGLFGVAGRNPSHWGRLRHFPVEMHELRDALQGFSLDCIQASSQAAEAFREGGDMAGLASALRTLAAAHLQKKSPSQAAVAAKESASLYKDLGDQTGEADSLLQLTVAQLEAERPEDAMPTAKAAHDLCKKVSDMRRCALAQELVQLAQTFDKQFKSGLWAPTGKGLTAKIASGMGGDEVRLHRWIPPPNCPEYTAREEQGQHKAMQDRKFGAKLPFQRKPFPWVTPKEKEKPADPEPEPVAVSEAEKAKVAGFDWSSTISQPAPVGGLEGYWRCERCGVLFEDPSEGARADADGNFEWFCRSCWRDWVDEHLRRARAAKEAGVSTSQHGGKGGGRALNAKPTEQRQTETKPLRPLPSRQELQQLSLIELYKHARSSGADFKLLSIAMDSDNPKTGLLELLAPT